MQDISFVSSKDIEAQVLKSRFTDTLVKMEGSWFYGHFPGKTSISLLLPCQDLMLNEGITGPQYKTMNDVLLQLFIENVFFAGSPLVDDDLLKVTNPPRL